MQRKHMHNRRIIPEYLRSMVEIMAIVIPGPNC